MRLDSLSKAFVSARPFRPASAGPGGAAGIQAYQAYATADIGLIAFETPAWRAGARRGRCSSRSSAPAPATRWPRRGGEVVVTSFNPDYPLIRFGTGDLSAVLPGVSPCGRTNTRIRGWLGRADQTTKVRGMFVHRGRWFAGAQAPPGTRPRPAGGGQPRPHRPHDPPLRGGGAPEGLAEAVAGSVRELTKLRAEVHFCAPGSPRQRRQVIDDIRRADWTEKIFFGGASSAGLAGSGRDGASKRRSQPPIPTGENHENHPHPIAARLSLIAAAGLLGACSAMGPAPMAVSQDGLPDRSRCRPATAWPGRPPASGEITYECRDKANAPGQTSGLRRPEGGC